MIRASVGVDLSGAAAPSRWKTIGLVAAAAFVFVTSAVFVSGRLSAAADGFIGYVDVARIIDEYLAPVLDEPLAQETARLQAEFDRRAQSLSEPERQELFVQYQALLNVIKQDMIDQHLPHIDRAVAAVAVRERIGVVLEKQAVLYGGVDLTEMVLAYLRSEEGQSP